MDSTYDKFQSTVTVAGAAKSGSSETIPFIVESDVQLLVLIDPCANTKQAKCLAHIACQAARDNGIPQLSMSDHDITPKVDPDRHT